MTSKSPFQPKAFYDFKISSFWCWKRLKRWRGPAGRGAPGAAPVPLCLDFPKQGKLLFFFFILVIHRHGRVSVNVGQFF